MLYICKASCCCMFHFDFCHLLLRYNHMFRDFHMNNSTTLGVVFLIRNEICSKKCSGISCNIVFIVDLYSVSYIFIFFMKVSLLFNDMWYLVTLYLSYLRQSTANFVRSNLYLNLFVSSSIYIFIIMHFIHKSDSHFVYLN